MFDPWNGVRRLLLVCVDALPEEVEPALSCLHDALPGVHLTLWAAPELHEAATALPGVAALLPAPGEWLDDLAQTVAVIRDGRYDAALILSAPGHSPYGAAYACYLAGVPVRLGQSAEFGGAVLSHCVIPPAFAVPPVDYHLHLVSRLLQSRSEREVTPEPAGHDGPIP